MTFNKALIRPYMPRGSSHYKSIFQDHEVVSIREQHKKGLSYSDLAKQYGTRADTVRNLCLGYTYANIGGPRAIANSPRKVDDEQFKRQVRAAYFNGMSYKKLCDNFDIGIVSAHKIVKGIS